MISRVSQAASAGLVNTTNKSGPTDLVEVDTDNESETSVSIHEPEAAAYGKCYHRREASTERVGIVFMGEQLDVDISKNYGKPMCIYSGRPECRHVGIVRSTPASTLIPFKYGDKVDVYSCPSMKGYREYYIVMDHDDIHTRVYEPRYQYMLKYVKKLHAMKLDDAYFMLTRDKSVDKDAVIYFGEGKDNEFAMHQAGVGTIHEKCGVSVMKDLWLLGYKYDVLVRFNKEVGYDQGQTHIYEAVIWKTNYQTCRSGKSCDQSERPTVRSIEDDPNPIEDLVRCGTNIRLSDDHDGMYHIIVDDAIVDTVVKYRIDKLRVELRALSGKSYYEVYEALVERELDDEDDEDDDNNISFEKLFMIGDEDAILRALSRVIWSEDDDIVCRLSNWKVELAYGPTCK